MKLILSIILLAACCHAEIVTVTAYCPCAKCCGKQGQPTASGKMPVEGVTVAASRKIPFGTVLQIEGVGRRIVQDRLAKRYDDRVDVFFTKHDDAKKFGIRKLNVTTVNPSRNKP